MFTLGRRGLLGGPLVWALFWTVASGTALAVRLGLRSLFELLGQEFLVDAVQGVGDDLGAEPVGGCLEAHLSLESAPRSVEGGAVMLGVHRVDLQQCDCLLEDLCVAEHKWK